jgi:hypothetical protein
MAGEEADAGYPLDLLKLLQETDERRVFSLGSLVLWPIGKIIAIAVHYLPQQGDLLDSLGSQGGDLG